MERVNIVEEIGLPAMFGQLAEEATELAQAALKLQRIQMGVNPTPVTEEHAFENLQEEEADVMLCLDLIHNYLLKSDTCIRGYHYARSKIYEEKLKRWKKRLMEMER